MKRNTLDLDYNDQERIMNVCAHVLLCQDLEGFKPSISPSMNGIHLELFCSKDCELCRFVFDDQTRFMLDQKRARAEQNVLFDKKVYKKMDTHIVLSKFTEKYK